LELESQWKENFDVTVAAKDTASWSKFAIDMSKHLSSLSTTKAAIRVGHYDRIVFVMGTNEVPKTNPRTATWDKWLNTFRTVLQGAVKYLSQHQIVEGRTGDSTPASGAILVVAPFHVQDGRPTVKFVEVLQEACSQTGSAYVHVDWNQKAHRQGKENKFNMVGAKLLVSAVNQAIVDTEKHGFAAQRGASVPATATAVEAPSGSQSVSGTGQPGFFRVDTSTGLEKHAGRPPSGSESSSSSGSSSSSSSSHNRSCKAKTKAMLDPSTHTAQQSSTQVLCEICHMPGLHTTVECPLVMCLQHGGDEDLGTKMLTSLGSIDKSKVTNWGRRVEFSLKDVKRITIPGDGNCLFSALALGSLYCKNPCRSDSDSIDWLKDLGAGCRARYLDNVTEMCAANYVFPSGLALADMLRHMVSGKSVGDYVLRMTPPISSRRQWGSYAEASVMAGVWKVQVGFFGLTGQSVVMLQEPMGLDTGSHIAVLWNGSHYDLLVLDRPQWHAAQKHLSDGTGTASASLIVSSRQA
jgi:hypothetical protein